MADLEPGKAPERLFPEHVVTGLTGLETAQRHRAADAAGRARPLRGIARQQVRTMVLEELPARLDETINRPNGLQRLISDGGKVIAAGDDQDRGRDRDGGDDRHRQRPVPPGAAAGDVLRRVRKPDHRRQPPRRLRRRRQSRQGRPRLGQPAGPGEVRARVEPARRHRRRLDGDPPERAAVLRVHPGLPAGAAAHRHRPAVRQAGPTVAVGRRQRHVPHPEPRRTGTGCRWTLGPPRCSPTARSCSATTRCARRRRGDPAAGLARPGRDRRCGPGPGPADDRRRRTAGHRSRSGCARGRAAGLDAQGRRVLSHNEMDRESQLSNMRAMLESPRTGWRAATTRPRRTASC